VTMAAGPFSISRNKAVCASYGTRIVSRKFFGEFPLKNISERRADDGAKSGLHQRPRCMLTRTPAAEIVAPKVMSCPFFCSCFSSALWPRSDPLSNCAGKMGKRAISGKQGAPT
jgi:hypothetical protein